MPSKFLPDISAEDCAIEIKMIDPVYLGYIAWGEIYLLKEEKKQLGVDVMVELISIHPENPEAYFSLWSSCLKDKNIEHCLEVSDRLYICSTNTRSNEI